jgi:NADPH:quinone reductase-like Zn-dependent oxidoreductase
MDRCFADIFAQLASGVLKPLPVKTYPLADFAAGLREIRDRTQRGRIVLTQSD